MIKRMNPKEWHAYVREQLARPRDHATYLRMQVARAIPFSVLIGILASILTIYVWGFKEWSRMMMQLILGLTLAAAFLGPLIKRFEEQFK
jgi:hypothetical protein